MNNSIHQSKKLSQWMDRTLHFLILGISGCAATCFVQPMDLIKIRIQLKSERLGSNVGSQINPFSIMKEIFNEGGVSYFWKGIDSTLIRQMFYTTTRMGIYMTLYQKQKARNGREPSLLEKSKCSLAAGFFGALAGNPADLALADEDIKMFRLAFYKIVINEGFIAFGGEPQRSDRMMKLKKNRINIMAPMMHKLHVYCIINQCFRALAIVGFLSSFSLQPFDNAKTKLQKMKKDIYGKYPYASIFDAITKTMKREGFKGLWVGFPTYYFRMAPHTMITLLTQDWLTDRIKKLRQS